MSQIKPLPEELQKVAIQELGEVPERIAQDLHNLKTWIQLQPHLKARLDDQFLVQFLRGSKYSLERAKEKIDRFFSLRAKHPEMWSVIDVDEPKFRQFHNTGSSVILPTPLNDNGPRIVFLQPNYPVQEFTACDLFQYTLSLCEVSLMRDPYACINGVVAVHDFAKLTSDHIRLTPPSFIKKYIAFFHALYKFENTFPLRMKAIYLVNVPSIALKFLPFILPFMPEKLKNRLFISGSNLDGFREKFPKKYFPREYGGENGSLADLCADYNKVWDEYRDYFKQNAGTDESLRLGNSVDNDGEFGFGGSFRKINVD